MPKYDVYYAKNPTFRDDNLPKTLVEIDRGWTKVAELIADDMDVVFRKMQGFVWSPNGEARPLIEMLGLKHTSMSVGDLLYNHDTEKWFMCGSPNGWRTIVFQSKLDEIEAKKAKHIKRTTAIWEKMSNWSKIDWISLEHDLRQVLRDFKDEPAYALKWIDEYIAAHTLRGHELPKE